MLLFNTEREINTARELKKLLAIELDNVGSGMTSTNPAGNALSPKAELRQMQNQYVSLSARYGAEHPDVKAIKRQIKAFEAEYGSLGDKQELLQHPHPLVGQDVERHYGGSW